MVEKVAKMLKEMEADHKHNEIFKSMVFPDTLEMREKRDKAIVQCQYISVLIRHAILVAVFWLFNKAQNF